MQEVEISTIQIDTGRFQNRHTAYSNQSVQRIVNNYDERLMALNPIVLWKDSFGITWLLAGHSRLQAHKLLEKQTIKSIFFEGTEADAIEYALNSNNQSSRETILERVRLYRQQYGKMQHDFEGIQTYMLRYEDKRSVPFLLELLHLNADGSLLSTLGSLLDDTADQTQRATIESIASMVGRCRINFADKLTDAHENEMLRWLLSEKNLKSVNKSTFIQKIAKIVEKDNFGKSSLLNLDGHVSQKMATMQYEGKEKELISQITAIDTRIAELHKQLGKPCTAAERGRLLTERDTILKEADVLRSQLALHRSRKDRYEQAAEVEYDMFNPPPMSMIKVVKRTVAAKQNNSGENYRLKGVADEDAEGMVPIASLRVGDRYRRRNKPSYKVWTVLHIEGDRLTVTSGDNNVHTAKGEKDLLVYKML